MAITIASRKAKGRNLQKIIALKISELLEIPCGKDELIESREMGQSGVDIKLIGKAKELFPFAIEAKACETWSVGNYIEQAKNNTGDFYTWLLVMKKNRMKPVVLLESKIFKSFLKKNQKVQYNHITRKSNWRLIPEIENTRRNKKNGVDWIIKCGTKMCYTIVSMRFFLEVYSKSKMFKGLNK